MPFIEVKPPALSDDLLPAKASRHQLSAVADHRRLGKAGDVTIGNRDRVLNSLGEESKARPEDNRDRRPAITESPPESVSGFVDQSLGSCTSGLPRFPASPLPRLHNRIPAIV